MKYEIERVPYSTLWEIWCYPLTILGIRWLKWRLKFPIINRNNRWKDIVEKIEYLPFRFNTKLQASIYLDHYLKHKKYKHGGFTLYPVYLYDLNKNLPYIDDHVYTLNMIYTKYYGSRPYLTSIIDDYHETNDSLSG